MIDTVEWQISALKSYKSELYMLGNHFRDISGVYIMCKSSSPGRWSPIYVGEALNLNNRVGAGLNGHEKFRRAVSLGATHICVVPLEGLLNASRREGIERELVRALNPPLNELLVRG